MFTASGKRRRTSMTSTASKGDDDSASVEMEYQPETKRKKVVKLDPIEQCQQLYDIIRNHKKEDGVLLCEPFIRAPKRRQEPGYYEVVSNPMDMLRIQQKIKMDEYDDIEQMSTDVDLMVANAKAFYKRASSEHKDACDLWDLFVEKKSIMFDQDASVEEGDKKGKIILKMGKLARRAAAVESRKPTFDDGETSESSTATDKHDDSSSLTGDSATLSAQLEELFSAVILASDPDGRVLSSAFTLLPSKKIYPAYYEIIDDPIDLKMIATKIQTGEYNNLVEMERDLYLMCRNACQFNEPGSLIYKDAKILKRIVNVKRTDIEHGRTASANLGSTSGKSERIRNRRLRGGVSHSAITAALQYEDDEGEEEEDEAMVEEEDEGEQDAEDEEDGGDADGGEEEEEELDAKYSDTDNPLWLLYEAVCNHVGSTGVVLCEPFKKLPSKRYYPDYYKEVKNPMALSQIHNRIQKGEYSNITQVQADMNIMFENAKSYNRPDSDLYKWAVKLQKVVQNKVQELLNEEDSSNDDPPPILTKGGASDSGNDIAALDSPMDSSRESSRTPNSAGKKSPAKGKASNIVPATLVGIPKVAKEIPTELSKADLRKEQLKQRFVLLYNTLMETKYQDDNHVPVLAFMERPSKKDYPDYYRIITDPIDMCSIGANINSDKYSSTEELLKDFQRMFNNCRLFNEEGSLIYEDANRLEAVLKNKIKELGPEPGKKKKVKRDEAFVRKLNELLNTVKDYKDKSGRTLSTIFQKLPSKQFYPEYYDVIKNPMDLDRICHKVKSNSYDTLQQLLDDITLVLDNACKFNEPDSKIYKDALILQRLALQTKLSLSEDDDSVPDVPGAVREILTSIFTSVYNHQDEEGRCFTDTMAELPEFDEVNGEKVPAISLDVIKSRLDRGFYKRLDKFQNDMFLCFERARKLTRTDSQLFEDAVELQSFFIQSRDEICRNGESLKSPALAYTLSDLTTSVEALREDKKSKELQNDEDIGERKKDEEAVIQTSQTETFNGQTYSVGDFVYISPSPTNTSGGTSSGDSMAEGVQGAGTKVTGPKPNIANIQKLWTEPDGTKMFEGIWFFRPNQTYHIPTRKFLQKEVFRSEVRPTGQLSEILGKCWVMTVKNKEYFTLAPEGFVEDDVYVCEYRYSHRNRNFCKLKSWAFGSDRVKLIARKKTLEPIRVASVFRERVGKQKEELEQLEDEIEKLPPEEFPNVVRSDVDVPIKEGYTFYEQFSLPFGPVRAGDYVYVRVENLKKLVARVDTMWTDSNEKSYFHGPWFTSLSEISSSSITPGRTFYKQEIFQSSIADSNPLLSICGRCCVMDVNDYTKYRVTEIPEEDVFVCESMYEEARREIRKFEGLQKVTQRDPNVHSDELYFFRRPLPLVRVDIDGVVIHDPSKMKSGIKMEPLGSPMSIIRSETESMMEDSLDAPPSIASSDTGVLPPLGTPCSTTGTPKKAKGPAKKLVTGYILYSSEVRKGVAERHPDKTFGEISRIVGNDWRKKLPADKEMYEDRARKLNKEKEVQILAALNNPEPVVPPTPSTSHSKKGGSGSEVDLMTLTAALKKDPDWIFECCWAGCDWQFEDALDLVEHSTQDPKGHVCLTFKDVNPNEGEFQCQWKNCARLKKQVQPFPNLSRLLKHVKDIHILKGNGRIIHPDMRSKRLQLSRSTLASMAEANAKKPQVSTPQVAAVIPPPARIVAPPQPPSEPLFIPVPPRPQKLVHSEAYVRYIESLHATSNERNYLTNWDKTLHASSSNTRPKSSERLPVEWLGNGAGLHGTSVEALWALRNFMMRDVLGLRKIMH